LWRIALPPALACGIAACSSTRHVPQGQYLLDKATIDITDTKDVKPSDLRNYLRQSPNHEVLGCAKLQLWTYNLSGSDTTKWYNRWFRKLGQAPVIYDPDLTEASAVQLQRALVNRGYMDATVRIDTVGHPKKKKIDVNYSITAGLPHRITTISYEIADNAVDSLIRDNADQKQSLKPGDIFDRNRLDEYRGELTAMMRDHGYYAFTKDDVRFVADNVAGSKELDLTMQINPPHRMAASADSVYRRYHLRDVTFITAATGRLDTISYKGINIVYGNDRYLTPSTLHDACFLEPGKLYRGEDVERTYESLGRLGILKSINIDLVPAGALGDLSLIDARIYIDRTKSNSVSLELEGTNSEGDLGFGIGATYQHRNLAKGSELLTAKLRTSYESLSGNVEDLLHDRYTEYAAEVGITFPKFKAPLLSREFKRKVRASTEFAVSFNYQERPEYTRIIAGAAWKYRWANRQNTVRRTYDFVDINYVYLPHSTINFIDEVAPSNPLLRYSYEDHFIMRMGYTYYRTNRRAASIVDRLAPQRGVYTLRVSAETAGNCLYALSSLTGQSRNDGAYRVFGIQYSQYAKVDFDATLTRTLDSRNSFAFRVGAGIGVPYGNSSMIPFEKRFYAGGANGVRGWGVRALGPGSYDSHNSSTDFINQCGDIRLDLSAEYRAKLFWVFEGALFVDAGNIWTIHNYENQPGGMFKFNRFYKEIAASYGCGLRMDFTYFLLRLDLGLKAHNPASGQEPWPLVHPNWHRDATFHFAVGYPF
jgi:outer membrane protein assembly factor BamA